MITIQEKDGFIYESLDGNGMENCNMDLLQEKLIKNIKPEDTYIDLGAHIGTMSIPIIKAKSPKLSILVEANPEIIPLLEKNCEINLPDQNFLVKNFAVCDRNEVVEFGILDGKTDSSSMARAGVLEKSRNVQVQGSTIDSFLEDVERPVVMKVDIECAELMMFKGFNKHLRKVRLILMEWFREAMSEEEAFELLNIMEEKGFLIRDIYNQPITKEKLMKCLKEDIFLINKNA